MKTIIFLQKNVTKKFYEKIIVKDDGEDYYLSIIIKIEIKLIDKV